MAYTVKSLNTTSALQAETHDFKREVVPAVNLAQMLSLTPNEIAKMFQKSMKHREELGTSDCPSKDTITGLLANHCSTKAQKQRAIRPRDSALIGGVGRVSGPTEPALVNSGSTPGSDLNASGKRPRAQPDAKIARRLDSLDFVSTAVNVDGEEIWVQWASEERERLNPIDFISDCVTLDGEDISESWYEEGNCRPLYLDAGSHICPARRLKFPQDGLDYSSLQPPSVGILAVLGSRRPPKKTIKSGSSRMFSQLPVHHEDDA